MKKQISWKQVSTVFAVWLLGSLSAQAVGFTRLHDFALSPGNFRAELLAAPNGAFFGTASRGGAKDEGCIFKIDPEGVASIVASFAGTNGANPCGSLLLSSNGMFYGTTFYGGPASGSLATTGHGTVFRVSSQGELELLAVFRGTNGANPNGGLIQGQDGKLYGVTHCGGSSNVGTVFSIDSNGQLLTVLSFSQTNGANPCGALVEGNDGFLYGATAAGGAYNFGTVFKLTKEGALTTLAHFDRTNGAFPYAGLSFGADGKLYGTTQFGGAGKKGTVFSITTDGVLTTLVGFNGMNGAYPCAPVKMGPDGLLYGTTSGGGAKGMGSVFKMSFDGSLTTVAFLDERHSQPQAAVTFDSERNLYGTTYNGVQGDGSLFRIDHTSGELTSFGTFSACEPFAAVVPGTNGSLHGLTTRGRETVFHYSPSGVYGELDAEFSPGACADASLVQGTNGNFYGITSSGGIHNFGSVFMVTPAGELNTLVSFNRTNGAIPAGKLVQDSQGNFWGVTYCGGSFFDPSYRDPLYDGLGTVFKVTPAGALTPIFSFEGANGANPAAGLVKDSNGQFYGTTRNGGTGNCGTAFRLSPSGLLIPLVSFGFGCSAHPEAPLLLAADGNLYGTTRGSLGSYGSVFKMTTSGALTVLTTFNFSNGAFPTGGLVQGCDGNFYGATSMGGAGGHGTIFKLTSTGELTTLVSYDGQNGSLPSSELVKGPDGRFYGVTATGGASGGGTLFWMTLEPQFLPPCTYSDGCFAGYVFAETGQSFTVQFSTDLRDWQDLTTITNSIGTNWVADTTSPGAAIRFYRTVSN